jgi:integrase
VTRWRPAPGQDVIAWDDQVPGFGLRAYPNSPRRSWLIQFRVGRATRRHVLGSVGQLTPDQARKLAREKMAAVAAGHDPSAERRADRAAATVASLCDRYLELHARPRKRSWRDDEQRINAYLKPRLGPLRARDVTRAELRALHRWIGETSGRFAANRTLALVSHLYNWGEREGFLPEGHPNPARGVDRFAERPRERWLAPDEVGRVVTSLASEGNPHIRAYFVLALLLGTRKRELLRARWDDVDATRWTLRLPETKSGRTHELPLGRQARELVAALPRVAGNPHVFPGNVAGAPLSVAAIDQAWRRIRIAAGVPDARLHDLRRTLGSWVVQQTGSLALVGALLGHTDPRITAAHYARFADGSRRVALEAHGDAVLEAAGGRSAAAIVGLASEESGSPRLGSDAVRVIDGGGADCGGCAVGTRRRPSRRRPGDRPLIATHVGGR